MYRVYFYHSQVIKKGALYSLPFLSLAAAISQTKNEIGEGEPGLYGIIRKKGNPWVLWDSRRPEPDSPREDRIRNEQ